MARAKNNAGYEISDNGGKNWTNREIVAMLGKIVDNDNLYVIFRVYRMVCVN